MVDYEDIDYEDIIEMIYEELNNENEKNALKDIIKIYNLVDNSISDLKECDLELKPQISEIVKETFKQMKIEDMFYRIVLKYAFVFKIYDRVQMSHIYSSQRFLALNTYNDKDGQYKAASRNLKDKFIKYVFKYISEDGGCSFIKDGNEFNEWKCDLFKVLGIQFNRVYLEDKLDNRLFYKYLGIPLLINPIEMEKNIDDWKKTYVKYSHVEDSEEIEEIINSIKRGKLSVKLYVANCLFERERGDDAEKEAYEKIGTLKAGGSIWRVFTQIYLSEKFYNEKIKEKSKKIKEKSKKFKEKNKKFVLYEDKKNNAQALLSDIKEVTSDDLLGMNLGEDISYRLFVSYPDSIFEPVYDATFFSLTKNPYFKSPSEIQKLSVTILKDFYQKYYEKLNLRLKESQNSSEECYWFSEKMYGIKILKKIVEDIINGNAENATNGEKTSTKLRLNSKFIEFVNSLSQIFIPELQFFYWELYVTMKMSILGVIECINLADKEEIDKKCIQYFKKTYVKGKKLTEEELKKFVDENGRDTVKEYLNSLQQTKFIEKYKEDINAIYREPDIEFLEKKENQKYIKCICSDTNWFFRYITELSDRIENKWELDYKSEE